MTLTFQTNLDEFNAALTQYARLSSKGASEAVAKKGADFGWRLSRKLLALAPKKGQVRSERLAVLQAGGGIRIRKAALDYAKSKTISTATNIRTRKASNYREKTKAGRVKSGARSFWELAVSRELTLRESGRGFSALSARYKSLSQELAADRFGEQRKRILDRYNRLVSQVGFKRDGDSASLTFRWGGNKSSGDLAVSLQKPRQQNAIASALNEARADMMEYIIRKQNEAARALAI
jgi:hypothetical protein